MKKTGILFCSLLVAMYAQSYALVVTIGTYKNLSSLSYAHQDHQAYKKILHRWKVANITSLTDENASKHNILSALKKIARNIKKGDTFYLFFSGHGSSLYDDAYSMKFQQAGLTEVLKESGVVFPYDFDPMQIKESILIGKRDFKPALEAIDKKVKFGLIVFDACYSEQSVRGANMSPAEDTVPNIFTEAKGYPYRHLVYIASSVTEAASGWFSPLLSQCLKGDFHVEQVKQCLNEHLDKSVQIPVVLSYAFHADIK